MVMVVLLEVMGECGGFLVIHLGKDFYDPGLAVGVIILPNGMVHHEHGIVIVPEPVTLPVLVLGMLMAWRRQRERWSQNGDITALITVG